MYINCKILVNQVTGSGFQVEGSGTKQKNKNFFDRNKKQKKKKTYKNNIITTRSFVKMEDLKKFYFNLIILKQKSYI